MGSGNSSTERGVIELVDAQTDLTGDFFQFLKKGEEFPYIDIDLRTRGQSQTVSSHGPYRLEQFLASRKTPTRPPNSVQLEHLRIPLLPQELREGVARSLAVLLFDIREISGEDT